MQKIERNIPLKDKNWFQTGGPAKFYAEPTNNQKFQAALTHAHDNNLDIFILGKGANILISDNGFDGLVIRPIMTDISHKDYSPSFGKGDKNSAIVTAGAGTSIENLINYCLKHNIIGLEEFSGIPGTVGGSVYINIHYFKHFLSDFLHQAEVINKKTGKIETVNKQWFNFGYDQSKLLSKAYFLLSASFILKKVDAISTAYAAGRSAEIVRHRNARYPNSHTCGSFFRNFHDHEVTQNITGTNKKLIYVAYYLDKLGIKGHLQIGGASVSHKHANMLVNNDPNICTSQDIINLAKEMQKLVKENFGILPQPECQLIGFKQYPLLK